jgi:putative endonuclease
VNFSVYILFSAALDRYYTGMSKRAPHRLSEHLRGQTKWTSQADDWVKVFHRQVGSAQDARSLEKRIKAQGARRFLEEEARG